MRREQMIRNKVADLIAAAESAIADARLNCCSDDDLQHIKRRLTELNQMLRAHFDYVDSIIYAVKNYTNSK